MQIDNLEPGEELDWLVLHHVFDWKRGIQAFGEAPFRVGTQAFEALWPVSQDLAFAWRIVEHAVAMSLQTTMHYDPSVQVRGWRVSFSRASAQMAEGFGESAPLAISRAALRAVEAGLLVKSSARP